MHSELFAEYSALHTIALKAKESLATAPQGALHLSRSHGRPQFYLFVKGQHRTYLGSKDQQLIRQLAQKSYDESILKVCAMESEKIIDLQKVSLPIGTNISPIGTEAATIAHKRAKIMAAKTTKAAAPRQAFCLMAENIEQLQRQPSPPLKAIKAVYDRLPQERKELVTPYITPDADYASQWESREPDPEHALTQPGTLTTEKGDLVRSKSEVIIADRLYRAGIPYHYEQPIRIGDKGTILHPDFVVLNPVTRQEIIWEHFGLMDNADYVANALSKINAYATCGLLPGDGLIVTFESASQPLSLPTVSAIVSSLTSSNLSANN